MEGFWSSCQQLQHVAIVVSQTDPDKMKSYATSEQRKSIMLPGLSGMVIRYKSSGMTGHQYNIINTISSLSLCYNFSDIFQMYIGN